MMSTVLWNLGIAIIGVIGIFIGLLPDLKPEWQFILLPDRYEKREVGYKKLIDFHYVPRGKRGSLVALKRNDDGYEAIYNLLRSLDPVKILHLDNVPENKKKNGFGNISIDENDEWSGGATVMNRIISFKTSKNWVPICEIRDLRNIMDIQITRWFSRIGFCITFISILMAFVIGVRDRLTI